MAVTWIDRRVGVALASVSLLHIGLVVMAVLIAGGRLEADAEVYAEGMGGLGYVAIGAVALVIFLLLIPLAALGVAGPLLAFDLLGAYWALGALGADGYDDRFAWQMMAALFLAASALCIWLQLARFRRSKAQ